MFKAGAYLRLSKDDGDKEVSDSIENQKTLISGYVKEQADMVLIDYYIDDGYSGLNFERPAFIKMMADILKGSVDTVITKDMSRLGREHIETSNYIEKVFPVRNIRYVAILDNYDSLTGSNAEIAPFKSLLNDMYARDISKKVRGAFWAKAYRGEFIGAFAPFGYRKHPDNNDLLIIDDYAAAVVKRIFDLYLKGMSKLGIAKLLNSEGIPCPSEYKRRQGLSYKNSSKLESTSYWTYPTVNKILHNEVYTGKMVQRKSETISYKIDKKRSVAKENWIVVCDTHEKIIDSPTFSRAQSLLSGRSRSVGNNGGAAMFAGVFKCGDCGRAMSKTGGVKPVYYKCGTYKAYGKSLCAPHTIREDMLAGIVLQIIKEEARKALEQDNVHELAVFYKDLHNKSMNASDGAALSSRQAKINGYLAKSYEDYADGLLSKEVFMLLNEKYTKEANEVRHLLRELENSRSAQSEIASCHFEWNERFANRVDVDELTREMIVELLEYIKIYENKRLEIKLRFVNY